MPDDADTTQNVMTRYEYTGSILAGVLVLSLPALIIGAALGVLTLSTVSQPWFLLYATACLTAIAWVFGQGALKSARQTLGGN